MLYDKLLNKEKLKEWKKYWEIYLDVMDYDADLPKRVDKGSQLPQSYFEIWKQEGFKLRERE